MTHDEVRAILNAFVDRGFLVRSGDSYWVPDRAPQPLSERVIEALLDTRPQ